jgi:hypothetical protein
MDARRNKDPEVKIEVHPVPDLSKPVCDICNKRISEGDVALAKDLHMFYGEKS